MSAIASKIRKAHIFTPDGNHIEVDGADVIAADSQPGRIVLTVKSGTPGRQIHYIGFPIVLDLEETGIHLPDQGQH